MAVTLKERGLGEEDSDVDSPGFPTATKKFKLVWQRYFASIEEPYFFVLSTLRDSLGWNKIDKIKDIFSASESSAFYGQVGSRLSIAQDRAMQYSASIGKFMLELFKMARELRIIEERIKLHEDCNKKDRAADKALKGIWTDMVEGGAKNPGSVIGLSREVGFTILPDLFFGVFVERSEDVHDVVEKLKFNKKIKEVLARKLKSYMIWKEKTFVELQNRQKFMKKHIKQYYLMIKMYMNWLRPYLTHIKRLGMDESKLSSPDIISGFETSSTELELLFKKKVDDVYSVISVHFLFRTQPKMEFHQDGYQHRGPIHVGRVDITFRGYVWDEKQVEEYKKYRKEEDFEILRSINEEINAAMEMLGDDIKNYLLDIGEKLEQEEEETKEEEKQKVKITAVFDPFKHVINGFTEIITGKEMFKFKENENKIKKQTKQDLWKLDKNKTKAQEKMLGSLFKIFDIFKKAHGMLSW